MIDANSTLGGNQAFTFIGSQAFHNVAGELRAVQNLGTWLIEADVNGDGVADMHITAFTPNLITTGDFIL